MIPVLYNSSETEFDGNIICYLGECKSCIATEEINDVYEVEFQYPVWGKYYSEILEGRFVGVTHDDKHDIQPFEIYKRSAPLDGIVTFYAHHLSYKASRVIIDPMTANTPAGAFLAIPGASINNNPFTFWTSKSGSGQLEITVPTSLRSLLLAKDNSIASTFGGEYEFDKWQIKLHGERGIDTDVTIRYGKNLTGLNQTINAENLYNAVVPYWQGKIEGVDVLITPEDADKVVTLEGVTNPRPIAKDFSREFDEPPEAEDLIAAAREYLTNEKPWVPKENITINFIHLWQTDEYKDVSALQRVSLGDKITVYYPALGVTAEGMEVIRVVYNVLEDKYDSMELGTAKVATFMDRVKEDYDDQIKTAITGFEALMNAEIARATKILTNPGESHVLFYRGAIDSNGVIHDIEYGNGTLEDPEGILIMDTNNPLTARQVLIINKGGIGFSSTGISGPYTSSWTLDGRFTTDFIATWELMVNVIRLYGLMAVYEQETGSAIGGYIGYGKGRIDNNTTTDGIMLSNTNNLDGSGNAAANNRYVIVTTAGTRMQAGDQTFYLTDNLVTGNPSGNAILKVSSNFIINAGSKIQVVKSGTTHDGYSGAAADNYEIQLGNGNLRIVNGIIVGATAWPSSDYQDDIDGLLDLIHDNSDDISAQESRIAGNETGISNLSSALSSLESRVSALENGGGGGGTATAVFG